MFDVCNFLLFILCIGMDSILSGNYTCIAKNLYSEDSITYAIFALLAPSSPQIRLQHAASTSLKFHWSAPTDGGSPIQSMFWFLDLFYLYKTT